jgi:hypothetical protein
VDWACSTHGGEEKLTQIWFGKPRVWGPLATGRRSFEDNIKVIVNDIGLGRCGMNSSGSRTRTKGGLL